MEFKDKDKNVRTTKMKINMPFMVLETSVALIFLSLLFCLPLPPKGVFGHMGKTGNFMCFMYRDKWCPIHT